MIGNDETHVRCVARATGALITELMLSSRQNVKWFAYKGMLLNSNIRAYSHIRACPQMRDNTVYRYTEILAYYDIDTVIPSTYCARLLYVYYV